jgi:hypothetical protein
MVLPTARDALLPLLVSVALGCASGPKSPPAATPGAGGAAAGADAATTVVPDAATVVGGGGIVAEDAAPPPAPDAVASGEAGTPTLPGMVTLFDGSSFDNWVYDPAAWKIVDRAMVGKVGGGQSQAFTKADYGSFRLIVWSRMVNGNDHLGICFWGARPAPGKYGFGACLLVIPPNGAIWDYLTNTDNPKPNYQVGMADWHQTEILANQTTGRVQVAVNGKLVHDYQDPAAKLPRRKRGPIGMQIHKAGTESEYRDISVEVDPKSDQLLTLKP